jgi:hypothetical protein
MAGFIVHHHARKASAAFYLPFDLNRIHEPRRTKTLNCSTKRRLVH